MITRAHGSKPGTNRIRDGNAREEIDESRTTKSILVHLPHPTGHNGDVGISQLTQQRSIISEQSSVGVHNTEIGSKHQANEAPVNLDK